MEYVLIGDIHSQFQHVEPILAKYRNRPIDAFRIVTMGDIFEVSSNFEYGAQGARPLEQIADRVMDPIVQALARYEGIVGNQEAKFIKHMQLRQRRELPPGVGSILAFPPIIAKGDLCFIHGHQLPWAELHPDVFHPLLDASLMNYRVIFYGHNHDQRLFTVETAAEGTEHEHRHRYIELPFLHREPIRLDRNRRYLINVGDVKSTSPKWATYAPSEHTVTFHQLS